MALTENWPESPRLQSRAEWPQTRADCACGCENNREDTLYLTHSRVFRGFRRPAFRRAKALTHPSKVRECLSRGAVSEVTPPGDAVDVPRAGEALRRLGRRTGWGALRVLRAPSSSRRSPGSVSIHHRSSGKPKG